MHAHDRQYAWKYEYASRSRITMFLTGQAVTQAHVYTTDAYACRLPPRTSSLSSLKQGILIACQIPRRHGSFGSHQLNASLLHSCALRAALAQMHSVLTSLEQKRAPAAPASHFLPKFFLPPAAIFGGDGGSTNAGSSSEPDSASEDGAASEPVTELPAAGLGEPMKR